MMLPVAAVARKIRLAQRAYGLTDRQVSILAQVFTGCTSRQVAQALGMATETVDWHLKQVRRKMKVQTRGAVLAKVLGTTSGIRL